MREIYKGAISPQQKIVSINQKFGNTGIKSQQGTSRIIYDTLPITTGTTYRFFEDSASRNFPFTNTGSDGNKLGVGDTMVIESVSFFTYELTATGVVATNTLLPLPNFGTFQYALGIFNFEIANNKVLKNVMMTEALGGFYGKNISSNDRTIDLETQIVLPPLLPYVLDARFPIAITPAQQGNTKYIGCAIIGTGGIIAPRTTF